MSKKTKIVCSAVYRRCYLWVLYTNMYRFLQLLLTFSQNGAELTSKSRKRPAAAGFAPPHRTLFTVGKMWYTVPAARLSPRKTKAGTANAVPAAPGASPCPALDFSAFQKRFRVRKSSNRFPVFSQRFFEGAGMQTAPPMTIRSPPEHRS